MTRLLESCGAERDEDGSIIAVRTVGGDGRSRAHLGGRSIPAGVLSEFTDPLLTVHGQNDQLRLLRPDQQLAALDRFADKTVGPLLSRYGKLRSEWVEARNELLERTSRTRELAQEADQLTFALEEIDRIAPTPARIGRSSTRSAVSATSTRCARQPRARRPRSPESRTSWTVAPARSTCSVRHGRGSRRPMIPHWRDSGHDWARRWLSSPMSRASCPAISRVCRATPGLSIRC
ncbi:hypothetical protein GS500_09730 [Rhodococcus hoagii]|nr:hypothetical protein [Prescottella equi]